jgi:hypothetical protein
MVIKTNHYDAGSFIRVCDFQQDPFSMCRCLNVPHNSISLTKLKEGHPTTMSHVYIKNEEDSWSPPSTEEWQQGDCLRSRV